MKEEFQSLFEYNNYYNQKLIDLISQNFQSVTERTLLLMNHIVNAQQIWNARIVNAQQFEVWQMNSWNEIVKIDNDNYFKSLEIITETDLEIEIKYINSSGVQFSNTIKDILFHVINHSTYHRAQIATDLKQNGIDPINTDFIFYKRKLI